MDQGRARPRAIPAASESFASVVAPPVASASPWTGVSPVAVKTVATTAPTVSQASGGVVTAAQARSAAKPWVAHLGRRPAPPPPEQANRTGRTDYAHLGIRDFRDLPAPAKVSSSAAPELRAATRVNRVSLSRTDGSPRAGCSNPAWSRDLQNAAYAANAAISVSSPGRRVGESPPMRRPARCAVPAAVVEVRAASPTPAVSSTSAAPASPGSPNSKARPTRRSLGSTGNVGPGRSPGRSISPARSADGRQTRPATRSSLPEPPVSVSRPRRPLSAGSRVPPANAGGPAGGGGNVSGSKVAPAGASNKVVRSSRSTTPRRADLRTVAAAVAGPSIGRARPLSAGNRSRSSTPQPGDRAGMAKAVTTTSGPVVARTPAVSSSVLAPKASAGATLGSTTADAPVKEPQPCDEVRPQQAPAPESPATPSDFKTAEEEKATSAGAEMSTAPATPAPAPTEEEAEASAPPCSTPAGDTSPPSPPPFTPTSPSRESGFEHPERASVATAAEEAAWLKAAAEGLPMLSLGADGPKVPDEVEVEHRPAPVVALPISLYDEEYRSHEEEGLYSPAYYPDNDFHVEAQDKHYHAPFVATQLSPIREVAEGSGHTPRSEVQDSPVGEQAAVQVQFHQQQAIFDADGCALHPWEMDAQQQQHEQHRGRGGAAHVQTGDHWQHAHQANGHDVHEVQDRPPLTMKEKYLQMRQKFLST